MIQKEQIKPRQNFNPLFFFLEFSPKLSDTNTLNFVVRKWERERKGKKTRKTKIALSKEYEWLLFLFKRGRERERLWIEFVYNLK